MVSPWAPQVHSSPRPSGRGERMGPDPLDRHPRRPCAPGTPVPPCRKAHPLPITPCAVATQVGRCPPSSNRSCPRLSRRALAIPPLVHVHGAGTALLEEL